MQTAKTMAMLTAKTMHTDAATCPVANETKCPFCNQVYKAGRSVNSNFNRNLKQKATKPDEKQGNHPKDGTPTVEEIKIQRSYRSIPTTEEKEERNDSQQGKQDGRKACAKGPRQCCASGDPETGSNSNH